MERFSFAFIFFDNLLELSLMLLGIAYNHCMLYGQRYEVPSKLWAVLLHSWIEGCNDYNFNRFRILASWKLRTGVVLRLEAYESGVQPILLCAARRRCDGDVATQCTGGI